MSEIRALYKRFNQNCPDICSLNISHSGEYVLCAFGKDLRVGIDVEEIRKINFDEFRKVMKPEQWQDLSQSTNPTQSFFKY